MPWEGYADIIRHGTQIHKKEVQEQLSDDAILFLPDPLMFEYIRKQIRIANSVYESLNVESFRIDSATQKRVKTPPYVKELAKKAKDTIMNDIHTIMILKRNDPNNWMLRTLMERSLREQGEEEERGQGRKLLERLTGKRESPQVIEMEE